jgi:hypothetical protein
MLIPLQGMLLLISIYSFPLIKLFMLLCNKITKIMSQRVVSFVNDKNWT